MIPMAEFTQFTPGPRPSPVKTASNGTVFVDYRDSETLRRLMTPNGKIQGRKRTGLTARHQRMVAQAIKRARYMGLLPYTSATL
jgi:small subunit ribosomal protein S18